MRSSISMLSLFWLACSFAAYVVASEAIATITPCPECPKSIAPALITVTEQYQPVSTCKPSKSCTGGKKGHCEIVPSVVSSYLYVSTVIPCLEGSSSVTVTKTEQIIPLQHHSSVFSSVIPCITEPPVSTSTPGWNNGTQPKTTATCTPETQVHTLITDITCPFNELGPMGNAHYSGSGLCKACVENPNGDLYQNATVTQILDGSYATQTQTWASTKSPSATSVSTAHMSTTQYCPSNGVYSVPISSAYTPSGDPVFTEPVTTTVTYTTTITNAPVSITCESSVPIEFTAPPQTSEAATSYVTEPISTSTYCPSNGPQTIPIVTTYTPTGEHSSLFTPVETTVYYTTSVTNAPTEIECTTTITLTLTESTCLYETIGHETTQEPAIPSTEPAPVSAEPTTEAATSEVAIPTYESPEPTTEVETPEPTISEAPIPTYEPAEPTTEAPISTYEPVPVPTYESVEPTSTEAPIPTYEPGPVPTYEPSEPTSTETPILTYEPAEPTSEAPVPTYESVEPTSEAPVPTYESVEPTTEAPVPTYEPAEPTTSEVPITTYAPAPTPSAPTIVDTCDYAGCFGSKELFFPTFHMVAAGGHMTIENCIDECQAQYLPYAGLYRTDCYCGESIEQAETHASHECAAPCPGNKLQSCGGGDRSGHFLLDIYECPIASSTSSYPTPTSTAGPENSSDPDPEPEPYQYDAPVRHRLARRSISADQKKSPKLPTRRGGVIRAPRAHVVVGGGNSNKEDLSVKKNSLLTRP